MKDTEHATESTVEPAAPVAEPGARGAGMVAWAQSLQRAAGNRAATRVLSRAVEMRAPGRGEASAFERRDEFVARINGQTPGVLYELDAGNRLTYTVLDPAQVVNFDTKMMQFIDDTNLAPMRLITNNGLVGGQRLLIDSFDLAYVDLDDMLACSDLSFQLNLIHFLEERLAITDYASKIGTSIRGFDRAHRAGLTAETEHLRSVVGDPTIEFVFEEDQGNGRVVFGYRSRPNHYRIFHIFTRRKGGVQGGDVFVLKDGERRQITIEEFLEERRVTAEAAATAAQVESERLQGATEHREGGRSVPAP
ncbi:MAG: hypothetical protein ABI611_18200 [Solirubrobacteraceae bacterium]